MKLGIVLMALLASSSAAQATPYDRQLHAITRSVPRDVRAFIVRQSDCGHWSGEEAYDAARRTEIEYAVRKLRCDALDRDERVLRARYRGNRRVFDALRRAKALAGE